ncbi:unnamed protein product [Owenia fusiformis]|uniref:Uncharacterized protein n=1 Tax=Owenia fusiformis TaxID=6347 RepID=A0A8J1UH60_OWEFU|nr:unnamed protein product [Owenia fusiformis]
MWQLNTNHTNNEKLKEENSKDGKFNDDLTNDSIIIKQKFPVESKNGTISLKEYLYDWVDNCVLHGIKNIRASKNTFHGLFWLIAVLNFTVCFVFFGKHQVTLFISKPVKQIQTIEKSQIEFPTITICPINTYSQRNMDRIRGNSSTTTSTFFENIQKMPFSQDDAAFSSSSVGTTRQFAYTNIYYSELQQSGHQAKDFIVSCRYKNRGCTYKDFKLLESVMYQNCYSFKANDSVDIAVETMGLSLVLFTEDEVHSDVMKGGGKYKRNAYSEAGKPSDYGAGVKVFIHPPGTPIDVAAGGITAAVGMTTDIGVNVENIKWLDDPYPNQACVPSTEIEHHHNDTYSQETCFSNCVQDFLKETCGCGSISYAGTPAESPPEEMCGNFANISALTFYAYATGILEWVCLLKNQEQFNASSKAECNCPPPCDQITYKPTISQGVFLPSSYQYSFLERLTGTACPEDSSDLPKYYSLLMGAVMDENGKKVDCNKALETILAEELVSKNFLRVNVKFESTLVSTTTMTPDYTGSDLFSDLGGTLGLCLGGSMVGVVEICELLVGLFLKTLRKIKVSTVKPINKAIKTAW